MIRRTTVKMIDREGAGWCFYLCVLALFVDHHENALGGGVEDDVGTDMSHTKSHVQ